MIVTFVNRKEELSILNTLFESGKAHLVVVYGRRRVGKTRLLIEFLKEKSGLYFYVSRGGEEIVLSEFSKAVEQEFFLKNSKKELSLSSTSFKGCQSSREPFL